MHIHNPATLLRALLLLLLTTMTLSYLAMTWLTNSPSLTTHLHVISNTITRSAQNDTTPRQMTLRATNSEPSLFGTYHTGQTSAGENVRLTAAARPGDQICTVRINSLLRQVDCL